jgi:integrase
MTALREREGIGARALEFTIISAARSGETRRARWSEIDATEKTWTVPGSRMKSGRLHTVLLAGRALEILEMMKPLRDLAEGHVFTGLKGTCLSDMALSKLVRRMGYSVTPHGFRSTFQDWAAETTNHQNIVSEAALAHVVGDKVEAAYRRGDLRQAG